MTLGEKIKKARTENGLTQEALAAKLMVSRQAVTKWETDKGTPDITNLKTLAQLLNVSLDYLLDDGAQMDLNIIREKIDLSQFGTAVIKKKLTDKLMAAKFPDAQIRTLLVKKERDKADKAVDAIIWLTTPLVGITDFLNSLKLIGTEYYLVNQDDRQFFVSVNYKEGFMETRRTAQYYSLKRGDKFSIGDLTFTDAGPISIK